MTKKTTTQPPLPPPTPISVCNNHFVGMEKAAVEEVCRTAVELARAVTANAQAIEAIAKALMHSNVINGPIMHFQVDK